MTVLKKLSNFFYGSFDLEILLFVFFQAAEVTGDTQEILIQRIKEHFIPSVLVDFYVDYRHFDLE